jgi:translation initiation factor 1
MADERLRLVYSTDGAIRQTGRKTGAALSPIVPQAQQRVRVRLERKGRGGKTVTVIEGLCMPDKDRELLLKELKASLGTGGAVRDTSLEIQGDHRDMIMATLENRGYRPKHSGS